MFVSILQYSSFRSIDSLTACYHFNFFQLTQQVTQVIDIIQIIHVFTFKIVWFDNDKMSRW